MDKALLHEFAFSLGTRISWLYLTFWSHQKMMQESVLPQVYTFKWLPFLGMHQFKGTNICPSIPPDATAAFWPLLKFAWKCWLQPLCCWWQYQEIGQGRNGFLHAVASVRMVRFLRGKNYIPCTNLKQCSEEMQKKKMLTAYLSDIVFMSYVSYLGIITSLLSALTLRGMKIVCPCGFSILNWNHYCILSDSSTIYWQS